MSGIDINMDKNEDEKQPSEENDAFWEQEKQIKFSIATSNDIKEMQQFLHINFLKSEPISMNMELITDGSGGWLHRKMTKLVDKMMVTEPVTEVLHAPSCIVARSTISNNIVGVRIGQIFSRKDKLKKDMNLGWMAKLPKFLNLPPMLVYGANVGILVGDKLRLGKDYLFSELEDANMVYYCMILCVGDEARGKGIGTELIRRGYDIAKKAGCDYTMSGASSTFTQKIFKKLGNSKVLREARYEDYRKDAKGRPFLADTGIHKSLQVTLIDHREKKDQNSG